MEMILICQECQEKKFMSTLIGDEIPSIVVGDDYYKLCECEGNRTLHKCIKRV